MCGIVGYIGSREATPILVDGLKRLEYRGYDSAGVAVFDGSQTKVVRCEGKLQALQNKLETEHVSGQVGIGHTRWATHGKPSDDNAHPHKVGPISVVHNGIIENHVELRQSLEARGAVFTSDTDTEIVAHLVSEEATKHDSLLDAVRSALGKVRGAYALVVMSDDAPESLVVTKSASPLVIGVGDNETFIASDITAILHETRDVIVIEEGEFAQVQASGILLYDAAGSSIEREPTRVTWSAAQAEKGGYRHFMLKEIHEQPRALADTLAGRIELQSGEVMLDDVDFGGRQFSRVVIVACGTSYHAGLVGEFLIEELSRIPTEVDLGSEFRYRNPIIREGDLVVAISQSGETMDTLAAVNEAKRKGASVLSIANVVGSSIPRTSQWCLYTHAGPEIGVASTKAFTTQIAALTLLAVRLGLDSGELDHARSREILDGLTKLPTRMSQVLKGWRHIQAIAKSYGNSRGFFFLGRGALFPIALEGALKLKEISYIHAEGYAGGEMKHGPLALIDEDLPTVVIAPQDATYEKILSNLHAVKARDGRVIVVATQGDPDIESQADEVIWIPKIDPILLPILATLPLQLLSYYVADLKGTDIDQPRNLAKSVTVE